MKKSLIFVSLILLSVSFVSAGWFSDLFGIGEDSEGISITGNAIWAGNWCGNGSNVGADGTGARCPVGHGDCDSDNDCQPGLVCVDNVGA